MRRQSVERCRGVAGIGRSVHEGERRGREIGQRTKNRPGVRSHAHRVEHVFRGDAGGENVGLHQGGTGARMRKEIAAKKSLGIFLEDEARFPAMGHMRRVAPANALAAEIDRLAIVQCSRRAIGEIVKRDLAARSPMHDRRAWCYRQPLVHAAAFVRLHMAETDPAQSLQRQHGRDGFGHRREHASRAAMEQHRFVGQEQKLVEREAGGCCHFRHEGGEPINAVRDFMRFCLQERLLELWRVCSRVCDLRLSVKLVHGIQIDSHMALHTSAGGAVVAGVTGFLLAWLRTRSGSLVLPILAHNATNVVLESVPLLF